MINKNFFKTLLLTAAMSSASLNAQVTIGSDKEPEGFSILELISNGGGLRLPQMTAAQRDTLDGTTPSTGGSARMIAAASAFQREKADKARGLTFFNIDSHCLETWNGTLWVTKCRCGSVPCCPENTPAVPFGNSLTLAYGQYSGTKNIVTDAGVIAESTCRLHWYAREDADVFDTIVPPTAFNTASPGTTEYWVAQWRKPCESPRLKITVNVEAPLAEHKIFAPVSVMYTYQYQDLTLYKGESGSDATEFKWYVKKKGVSGDGTVIPSATSATYCIPSNYRNSNDTLVFTCEYANPVFPSKKVSTEIEFIHLNPANKIQINGADYYWVELDAANPIPTQGGGNGKLKILATNLGVETNNAADFGDLYQWGRVADGHERIGWSYTGTTARTVAFDAATSTNQIAKSTGTVTYDANAAALEGGVPFMQVTDNDHKGKFITASIVWQASSGNADRYIWATSAYAKTANDPCPAGWHVPTRYEWGALATGGSGTTNVSSETYPTTYNNWRFPSAGFGSSAHVGGIVVTRGTDPGGTSRVFLPTAGYRGNSSGLLNMIGSIGSYWSSTYGDTSHAYILYFDSSYMHVGYSGALYKASGKPVRCVEN